MTALAAVMIGLAGGLGAVARYAIDAAVTALLTRGGRPLNAAWGTIAVNLSGSLAVGVLAALAAAGSVPAEWAGVIGVGFLGGYTTFSAASYEAARLLMQRRWLGALLHGPGQLVLAVAGAAAGWHLVGLVV